MVTTLFIVMGIQLFAFLILYKAYRWERYMRRLWRCRHDQIISQLSHVPYEEVRAMYDEAYESVYGVSRK